jgi:hypothetical protein
MGKLHTLRRAIQREPRRWWSAWSAWYNPQSGQWEPKLWWHKRSYRSFIQAVLRALGPGEQR